MNIKDINKMVSSGLKKLENERTEFDKKFNHASECISNRKSDMKKKDRKLIRNR